MVKKTNKQQKKQKKAKSRQKSIKVMLAAESAISNSKEAVDLYSRSRFGEIIKGRVLYSLAEALYLLEKNKIEIFLKKKKLNFNQFMQEARDREKNFYPRYCVYSDLRNKGYIVKTALKFGADFRVYERGVKPGQEHAKWIVYPVYETSVLTWHEFSAKNRVAHSTKKKLLIGVVDEEGEVTYYEVEWKRP